MWDSFSHTLPQCFFIVTLSFISNTSNQCFFSSGKKPSERSARKVMSILDKFFHKVAMLLVHGISFTLLQCTVVLKSGRQRFKTIFSNL